MRIKINQIQLKETKEENKTTHERVAADRHFETQAAIVRIMKSRKTIKHQELIVEVTEATRSRGMLQPAEIKTNIEKYVPSFINLSTYIVVWDTDFGQVDREGLHGTRGQEYLHLSSIRKPEISESTIIVSREIGE